MDIFIPTAITRYEVIKGDKPFAIHHKFRKSLNVVNNEIVQVYGNPHIVVRWSPINIVVKRLLRRL